MTKNAKKPDSPVKVWPQTYKKLRAIATENKRKLNATIDQLADEYLERNRGTRRTKQLA